MIRKFALEPHPGEGGYFRETYRTRCAIPAERLPADYAGPRSAGTAIYYLLAPDSFSALHRVRGDEVFHFYLGDPVEMLQLDPEGTGRKIVLGQDVAAGMAVQVVVPGGVWQGARLREGGRYALLGTTMSPGFEYDDFELGGRAALIEAYPAFRDAILRFTRES